MNKSSIKTKTSKGKGMQKATAVKKTKTKTKPPSTSTPTLTPRVGKPKNEYLNNRALYEEVKKCRKKGVMSDTLAKMLTMLCDNFGRKGSFVNYSYNEDMRGYAMLMLVRTWRAFDPEKSNNPFAFFTQCIKHSFIQYLNQEKRQRNIRDLILVDQGLNPSFSFLENGTEQQNRFADDEQDYHAITHEAQQLKQTPKDPSTDDAIDFPDEDSAVTVDQDDDSRDDAR